MLVVANYQTRLYKARIANERCRTKVQAQFFVTLPSCSLVVCHIYDASGQDLKMEFQSATYKAIYKATAAIDARLLINANRENSRGKKCSINALQGSFCSKLLFEMLNRRRKWSNYLFPSWLFNAVWFVSAQTHLLHQSPLSLR